MISCRRQKTVAFFLANYEDADELMEALSVLDTDKFVFYDKTTTPFEDEV